MSMYVITHKHFDYQRLPVGYVPLLVGANKNANPDRFLTDNTSENISDKNASFCEETGLYWMWKNIDDRYLGLSHYRRFFAPFKNRRELDWHVLIHGTSPKAELSFLNGFLQSGVDWIVSQPEKMPLGSVGAQFSAVHHRRDLDITAKVIDDLYPEYHDDFEEVIYHNSWVSLYNMFYTSKEEIDAYCQWLFDVLFEVEKRTDISNYDAYQQRLYGFLSERLLNVWLHHRQPKIKYLPVYEVEDLTRNKVLHIAGHTCKQGLKKILHMEKD